MQATLHRRFQNCSILEENLEGHDFDGGPIEIDDLKGPFWAVGLGFEDVDGIQCRAPIIRMRRVV